MKNILFLLLFLPPVFSFSQSKWAANPLGQKAFIENKGQFADGNGHPVLFGATCEGTDLFFSSAGLTYRHVEYPVMSHEEREEMERGRGDEIIPPQPVPHYLHITWVGANPHVKIVAEVILTSYYTYPDPKNEKGTSSLKAAAYKKIIYKDLYPNIDLEYIFPENKGGVKYSLILHPGADPSQIKMKYEGARSIVLDASGNIVIQSSFGEFVDHAPQTFYAKDGSLIHSAFSLRNNMVSFTLPPPLSLGRGAGGEVIVIDPWATNPAFPGFNSAYDVEYDNAGNVYVYGGACPYIVVKMNSAGAIQWTFTATLFTFAGYYGDFCVDPNSQSVYVCEGAYWPWTGSRVAKLNAAGAQIALFPTGNGNMRECWRAVFDNCNKKLILAGSSFNNSANYQGFILDTIVTNLTSVNVLVGTTFFLNEQDMALLAMDNSNNVFMGNCGNENIKMPAATLAPSAYVLPNNHTFTELGSIAYIRNINPSSCGMNGMAASNQYLYTYDGGLLQRFNKNTGAFMNSTTLSATKFRWGGISVDGCDNIFVGTPTGVAQYDTTFTVVANFPSPAGTDTVYDVRLGPGNKLYSCGRAFAAEYQLTLASCSAALTVSVTATGSCTGQGSATASASGGTGPYSYAWNPSGQTSATATGLLAGNYTVTVTDNSFCVPNSQTATVAVTSSGSTLSVTPTQTNLLCNGSGVGSATVTATGGAAPLTYSWSPSAGSTSVATGLAAGTYTALVTDATGCIVAQIFTISQPAAIVVTANSTSTTCTSSIGTVTANTSGGTPGYTYLWTNGASTSSATGLSAGTYSVLVTDANGCTKTQSVTVSSGGGMVLNTTSTQTGCSASNGTATANPSSGTTPYTYSWSNGQSTQTATGLAAGSYSVTVSDASGCVQTQVAVVTAAAGPLATLATTSVIVSGGTAPFTYAWNPLSGLSCSNCPNPTATPTVTTTYCVLVTDANNCSDSVCVTIVIDVPCGTIYVPNAFSPNNDLENDFECVIGACVDSLHFTIYNRWGEIVFESTDQKICWDGTHKGKPLDPAVFTYYMEATIKGTERIIKQGNISLIR